MAKKVTKKASNKKNENQKVVSILSYFLIGIIWYFVDEKVQDSQTKHHVKQAINLFLFSLVGNFLLSIIIFIGWVLMPIFQLFVFVLWIIGIINAVNMSKNKVPLIGEFVDKYLKF